MKTMTLPSALDFQDLPSDRNVEETLAARLIRELAEACLRFGPHGCYGVFSDIASRDLRRIRAGEDVGELYWLLRPGAFIEKRCTPEQRAILKTLTSEDVRNTPLHKFMCMDEDYAGPGLRWKFGHACGITETPRTAYKVGGTRAP